MTGDRGLGVRRLLDAVLPGGRVQPWAACRQRSSAAADTFDQPVVSELLEVPVRGVGEDRHVLHSHAAGATLSLLRTAALNLLRGETALWTPKTPLTARAEWINGHPTAVLAAFGGTLKRPYRGGIGCCSHRLALPNIGGLGHDGPVVDIPGVLIGREEVVAKAHPLLLVGGDAVDAPGRDVLHAEEVGEEAARLEAGAAAVAALVAAVGADVAVAADGADLGGGGQGAGVRRRAEGRMTLSMRKRLPS